MKKSCLFAQEIRYHIGQDVFYLLEEEVAILKDYIFYKEARIVFHLGELKIFLLKFYEVLKRA